MRRNMIRLMLVLAAAIALASFFFFDLQRYLSLVELKSQRDALATYAQLRPVVTIGIYFIAYVVMAAFSLPGDILSLPLLGAFVLLALLPLLMRRVLSWLQSRRTPAGN